MEFYCAENNQSTKHITNHLTVKIAGEAASRISDDDDDDDNMVMIIIDH